MFLNLPDHIFFEKEITRRALMQDNHDWKWYFHINTTDENLHVTWSGNCMNDCNYIILEPSDRTNRTVTFNINITSDPEGNDIKFQYQQKVELIFEENLTWVGTYYPEPNHFNPNSNEFKLNIIPLTSDKPDCSVKFSYNLGYQCFGMQISSHPAVVEVPINNFAPQTDWNYAIVYEQLLNDGAIALIKKADGTIKPFTITWDLGVYDIVLRPNECLLITGEVTSDDSQDFGIAYIWFFR